MTKPAPHRSIIRWAGSKRQLVPILRKWVPQNFKRYIEPFAGSACLYFDLAPREAILGDINSDLIMTYRQLRRNPKKLHDEVSSIPRTPSRYYKERAKNPQNLTSFERAVRFIFLNRNCFNAVYRVNKQGKFNVPWGTRTGELPSLEEFRACARLLRSASLIVDDFEVVIAQAKRGDFVYLDPPYSKSVADEPGLFGAGAFTRIDLDRLISATNRLDRIGAIFLLSFEADERLLAELPLLKSERISARRHVSGFSGARGLAPELLFTNSREVIT